LSGDLLKDVPAIFPGAVIPSGEVLLKTSPCNVFWADPHSVDRWFNHISSGNKFRLAAVAPHVQNVLPCGDVGWTGQSRPRNWLNQGIAGRTEQGDDKR
jgi:hypothetical protein